ncbi:hypothetical protein [Oscillibacter sp. GMB15532]|uniref:hypothetical protein n=1 Tax=Oscillibacter sp. GMB15532 TaxID=3230022 RepID=UPI0034DF1122
MELSISHPALLTISDEEPGRSFFGGAQEWYSTEWSRRAGCGPTCASNILAYLSLTRPALLPLYGHGSMGRADFSRHMEDVYPHLTPGSAGLNRVEMFSDGVAAYAWERGILLEPHALSLPGRITRGRPAVSRLAEFIKAGLMSDCPVGFLNLHRGKEKNLQSWHWVTIVAAEFGEDQLLVTVSDEGRLLQLDLRLWYLTTPMRGALAYFTEGPASAAQLATESAENQKTP